MLGETPNQPILRVLIYRSTSIGDVILATSCLSLLKKLQLPSQVYWVGRQPSLNLVASAFPEVVPIDVKSLDGASQSALREQFPKPPHIILDLQKTLRSKLICSNLSKTFGVKIFSWKKDSIKRSALIARARILGRSRPLTAANLQPQKLQFQMMVEGLRRALEDHLPNDLLDTIYEDVVPEITTHPNIESQTWQKELRFGHWIAVAPGATHRAKQAPLKVFEDSLKHFRDHLLSRAQADKSHQVGIVFLGDEKERKLCVELLDKLNWPFATLNLAGKISLWESAQALQETQALLCNDSALAHISEAVKTPVAALFGPTIESFGFAPHLPDSTTYSSTIGCRPCSKHGKAPCRYQDYRCFNDIDTVSIARKLLDLHNQNRDTL